MFQSYDLLLDIDDVEKRALALPEDARPVLFKERAQKIQDLYGRLYLDSKDDITLAQLLMVRKGAKLVARTVPFLAMVSHSQPLPELPSPADRNCP